MRIFRNIIIIAGIFFVVLLLGASILGRVFEDDLTRYVVESLNRQIRTEVKIGDVKLSFLKKFPDASLQLQDIFMASVPDFQTEGFNGKNTDTLLAAKHLFLRFDVLKLLHRQYLVREVNIQSGNLNIYIDREGQTNYFFWKKKETSNEKSFLVELGNVKLSDVIVNFDNRALQADVSGVIRKSSFKGLFSKGSFKMSAGLEGVLHHYSNKGIVFLEEKKISLSADMLVDPRAIRISEAELMLADQQMLIAGSILRPKPFEFDLSVEGKHLDLENILRHFWVSGANIPDDLRAGGELDFKGSINGTASLTRMPQIKAAFSLQNGWLQSSRFPHVVREIKSSGTYSNGIRQGPGTTLIELKGVSMRFGNSRLGGDYSVFNLIRPDFNYKIKTDLDLADIQRFKAIDSIFENMEGRVLAEIQMKGGKALLKTLGKADLLNYDYTADIRMDRVTLKFRRIPFHFRDFSGDAVFTDHLDIKNLSGIFEDSRVNISGRVDNFMEYLFAPSTNLWMDVDLYSERMDLNHLISKKSGSGGNDLTDTIKLPDRLFLKTRFWFDELEVRDFRAAQVTGDLIYKPRRFSINRLELLSMDGRVESEGILEQQQDMNFLVKSSSRIVSVDITKAFRSFDNFGQDFIVDQHIKGSLSGSVGFSAGLNERMKIRKETILTDCDVMIRNGELSGFEPMMKLSRFIDVEELGNVRFSTLTNEIFIRNEEVVIPNMDIHSSAFDITASGLHGFDGNFTYKVKVALSELLAQKSRQAALQDSEFGVVEDDGLGRVYVYLIIEGTKQGTEIRYDRRGAIQNIREQMREEKEELKQILKEELGLFKKDSIPKADGGDQNDPAFIIKWEEDSIVKRDVNGDNNSEKERFIIEWEDDEGEQTDSVPGSQNRRRRK